MLSLIGVALVMLSVHSSESLSHDVSGYLSHKGIVVVYLPLLNAIGS